MKIIKREVTTFPLTEDGRTCALLYFEHIKKTGVTPCNFKSDEQGYHVAGGYELVIDEQKMMSQENLGAYHDSDCSQELKNKDKETNNE